MNNTTCLNNRFCQLLKIEKPLLMAPMFLVSNPKMIKASMDNGIAAAIPMLNFREDSELQDCLFELSEYQRNTKGTYGVNLIVKDNDKYEKHLKIIEKCQVPFVVSSLGDPNKLIELVHGYGGKVLCDVTNLKYAEKAEKADGFIAVGQGAGGHSGNISLQILLPLLREHFPNKVILGAGGVANARSYKSVLSLGADGASVGTVFIASEESSVSMVYKQAVIEAKASDIVLSPILSGTPTTLIKTDYLLELEQQIKLHEISLSNGIHLLKKAGIDADYHQLFCAGQSVEFVNEIESVGKIIQRIL